MIGFSGVSIAENNPRPTLLQTHRALLNCLKEHRGAMSIHELSEATW